MADPTSFEITWRDGAYYVSVPNYKGGTVYTAAEHDRLTRENEALREALEAMLAAYDDLRGGTAAKQAGAALALKEPGQ